MFMKHGIISSTINSHTYIYCHICLSFIDNLGLKSKKSVPRGPSKARENMLDDDIKKRVRVNKDCSLSMEMKVRFRLLNDETLHCSTEIKKSSRMFNVSFPGQDNVYYPHCGHGESCSEAESLSASEAGDVYISRLYQKHLEEPHCQHCCTHCQEYDIWKNPAISEQETLRHFGSNSSSALSHKIKCKKESIDSVHTTSCEEYTEQVVEKATCIQQTVGEGDKGHSKVQYCTISRCCSRSEVCSVSTKAKETGYTNEKYGKNESTHVEEEKSLSKDQMSVQITQGSTDNERSLSAETNSSVFLASLGGDENQEETDLYPSNSRASQSNTENDEQTRNAVVSLNLFPPCKSPESPKQSLLTRTSSRASCCSVKSKTSRKVVVIKMQVNMDQDKNNTPSSTSNRCQHKELTNLAIENGTSEEELESISQSEDTEIDMRAPYSVSGLSKTCSDISDDTVETFQTNEKGRANVMSTAVLPASSAYVVAELEFVNKNPIVVYASEEENIEVTSHATSDDSNTSESPVEKNKSEEPADITYEEKVASAKSRESNVSATSNWHRLTKVACKERKKVELQKGERAQSAMSLHSNSSTISKESTVSEIPVNGIEDQTEVVMPCVLSKVSRSPQVSDLETSKLREIEDQTEGSSSSIISVKSSNSDATPVKLVKVQSTESLSALSTKTYISAQSITSKISEETPVDMDSRLLMERVPSTMSAKSDVFVRSKASNILHIETVEDHAPSAQSNKSNTSRSNTPKISTVTPKAADDVEEERLKRPSSNMSCKSAASVRSTKSKMREKKDGNTEKTKQLQNRYSPSVIPSKPSDSELSMKSKTSKATLDKSGDHSDEQASITKCMKSNKSEMLETGMRDKEERPLSATSSKSSVSKKSGKCKLIEAPQEYDHSEERSASIMSSISVDSKKSVFSDTPCGNEEEGTKQSGRSQNALSVRSQTSRKSKASEPHRQDTGDEDNREGALSTLSWKSILSDRSNLASDGVDNTRSTEHLLKETESIYEDDRVASAMSSKTQMSCLSNKFKDQTQERAPTSMSAKSNVYTKSKNSKVDQSKNKGEDHERALILASPSSNKSAQSKTSEYLAVVSPSEVENQSTERTLSAMSGKSKTSKTSKENIDFDCFREPRKANEEELVERAPTAASDQSDTSIKSKGSDFKFRSLSSPKSSTSAKDEELNFSISLNNSPNIETVKSEESWDIKIKKSPPSDMSAKSSVSVKSNISALDGGQNDTVNLNERSYSALSGLKISMTENSNNAYNEDRASSALSKKSNTSSVHHTSEGVLTPASASVSIGNVEEYNEEDNSVSLVSVNSFPQLNSKTDVCCKDSSKMSENENQQGRQTPDDRAKISLTAGTIVSDISKKYECTHKNFSQPLTDNEVANNKSAKKNSKKSSSYSLSSRSARSDFGSSTTKDRNSPGIIYRPKTNISNILWHLEVNGPSKCNISSDRCSKKDEEEISRLHSADVSIMSVSTGNHLLGQKSKEPVISLGVSNHQSTPSNEKTSKLNTTSNLNVRGKTCNGSLVATDCNRNVSDDKGEKNSNPSCRHSSSSSSSLAQEVNFNPSELVPSILPSSSPTEVVNEWLKKIPLDSDLYDVGDGFYKNCEEEKLLKMSGKVTLYERENGSDGDAEAAVLRPHNEQLGVEKIENNGSKVGGLKKTAKKTCAFPDVPSSVQLMRILLRPKLDKCNSLPEVSPVYRRKLSMSARGFLDSLVNLQLLDFDPNDVNGKAEKYNDLMNMLQSPWLCDPFDSGKFTQKSKCNNPQSNDEEFIVTSSSAVDINSTSQDCGKIITVAQNSQTITEGEITEILEKVQEIDKTKKTFNGIETKSNSATPDIASRVRWTPENKEEENMQDNNILSAVSDFTIRNNFSPREPPDTACISNKGSGNDSNANQKLTGHEDDTRSESSSSEQTAQVTEKVSQDPDPVCILDLLTKIEKQFMTHYATAMDEFKVRWNLNDNEQLDVMICELRDEVHKRIQESINTELRKIQGLAGRSRPPKETMSSESSILTEQRRRRLKVNPNQSIDLVAKTDDDNTTMLMSNFNAQQTDDEYCPCETCMKKKMSSRPVLAMEVSNSIPKLIDTDLRKVLHLKRNASINSKGNVNENVLLERFKEDKTQELYKANFELQAKSAESTRTSSLEQTESDTSNNKGYGKEYSQAVVGSKPQGVRKRGSSSSLEEDASNTQLNKSELKLKKNQPMKKGNKVFRTLEQESPVAGDELRGELHTLEAVTAKENMAIKPGTVAGQEIAGGKSTELKGTEDETSDAEMGDETAEGKTLEKRESLGEIKSENNEAVEGEISESDGGEIPDDEKEKHEDAVAAESTEQVAAKKEIDTTATEEPKIKSEIEKDEKEAEHKSDALEDGTDEDDSVVAEKSESTDNEERDANTSAEEGAAVQKINKENGEDEEKISEPAEDGDITEHESAEEANPMNDESANEGETDNDELDARGKTTKAETAADEEPADNETEYRENFYHKSNRSVTIKFKTAEDGETDNITTEDGETIGDKEADVEGMGEAKAAEDNDYESAEDAETSTAQTAEATSDDKAAEYGESPEAKISEGGEIADDGIAYDGVADDDAKGDAEIAEGGDTDDEISEIEEMSCNETADSELTTKANTKEYEETCNDGTSFDGEAAGYVVPVVEEAAEAAEENEKNDDRAEEPEVAKTEAEEIVDSRIVEDGEGDVLKAEGRANDDTAEDTEMDTSQSEEGETAEDDADNGEIANDGTDEDEKPSEFAMEKVDETTEAETENDREQGDDGRADGQIGDEVTDEEVTTGNEDENEETAEAHTGEDGETAEDRYTADERRAEYEELSENEIAQNGEIAKGITEPYGQTDDSASLENGETVGAVNAETHESNPKTKQNQGTGMFESNRYNINTPSVNIGESDEGGDEAEDETEPVVETNRRDKRINIPALQPTQWSLHKADKRTIASFDFAGSEDGADADGEDSETEVQD